MSTPSQNKSYKPTEILQFSSLRNTYYVVAYVPEELIGKIKDKRIRRSTGCKTKREAILKWKAIELDIYDTFDKLLHVDRFTDAVRECWDDEICSQTFEDFQKNPMIGAVGSNKTHILRVLLLSDLLTQNQCIPFFDYLDEIEARKFRDDMNLHFGTKPNPYPAHIQQTKIDKELAEASVSKLQYVNKTGCPTISNMLIRYMDTNPKWDRVTKKEAKYAPSYIKAVIEIIGDKPIDQVTTSDLHQVAAKLSNDAKANSTILTYRRHMSALLTHVLERELNDSFDPPRPWITVNVWSNVSLADYGKTKESYESLKPDQLHRLFELEMPDQDRLALSILITTGMRLDEVALLKWEQYKIDKEGLRYFDLSEANVKNDDFSARTVAIPDCLILPKPSKGRLFDYKMDEDLDNKSAKDASDKLVAHVHKIRYDKEDKRKVVHSLRHNLAGLMLNLRPTPSSEVMNWITGHGSERGIKQSERNKTYNEDVSVRVKYDIVNKIEHPWLK